MAALTSLTVGLSSSLGSIGLSSVVLMGRIIDTEGVDSVLISVVMIFSGLRTSVIQFNSIQVYLYSAFYDTIVAKRFTGN